MKFLVLFILSLFLSACAPDAVTAVIGRKYPTCRILKVEETQWGGNHLVTLQCPPAIVKTIKIKIKEK